MYLYCIRSPTSPAVLGPSPSPSCSTASATSSSLRPSRCRTSREVSPKLTVQTPDHAKRYTARVSARVVLKLTPSTRRSPVHHRKHGYLPAHHHPHWGYHQPPEPGSCQRSLLSAIHRHLLYRGVHLGRDFCVQRERLAMGRESASDRFRVRVGDRLRERVRQRHRHVERSYCHTVVL
jgi:hypothetical protein